MAYSAGIAQPANSAASMMAKYSHLEISGRVGGARKRKNAGAEQARQAAMAGNSINAENLESEIIGVSTKALPGISAMRLRLCRRVLICGIDVAEMSLRQPSWQSPQSRGAGEEQGVPRLARHCHLNSISLRGAMPAKRALNGRRAAALFSETAKYQQTK